MSVMLTVSGSTVEVGQATPLFTMLAPGNLPTTPFTANADLTKFVVVEAPFSNGQRFQVLTGWK